MFTVLMATPATAQCPNGAPPPCGRAAVRPAGKSLAVLPFESLGGDTANIYFAQGLADELTTALSHVSGLRVAASSSAFTFGSGGVDATRVGRALHVGAVLQGRVRRQGDRMRVVAQLTDANSGLLLWSNSYEREVRDVFAVQDDITRDIVAALRVTFAGERPTAHPGDTGTHNLQAYDLYLRGRFFLAQRGVGVARSIPYFEQAIALDSSFARGWAQLGTAWVVLPLFALAPRDSALANARAATSRALRLDPSSAEAHAAEGFIRAFAADWAGAISEYQRAIALDSGYSFTHRAFISTLLMVGRTEDGVTEARRTLELDPLNATTASVVSYALLTARRYDEAVRVARRGVELDSLGPLAWANLAIAQLFAGHRDEAIATVGRSPFIPNSVVPLAYVIGTTSGRDSIESLVRRLESSRDRNASALTAVTFAWLGAGDTTRALDALERMAQAREPVAFQAAFGHPAYDIVRHSPRFAAVVHSYGVNERLFTQP